MLPNLPLLSGDWQNDWQLVPINALDWASILPADPTRWSVRFSGGLLGGGLVTVQPEPTFQFGLSVDPGRDVELHYKDYGPLVQQQWYGFDTRAIGFLLVITACIRKLQPVKPIPPGVITDVS